VINYNTNKFLFLRKKQKLNQTTSNKYKFSTANSFFLSLYIYPSAVLNYEEDVAMYTIKVADDARTLNRVVTYQPPKNIVSQLELISLWEKKTGQNFIRVHLSEEELVKLSESKNFSWYYFKIFKTSMVKTKYCYFISYVMVKIT